MNASNIWEKNVKNLSFEYRTQRNETFNSDLQDRDALHQIDNHWRIRHGTVRACGSCVLLLYWADISIFSARAVKNVSFSSVFFKIFRIKWQPFCVADVCSVRVWVLPYIREHYSHFFRSGQYGRSPKVTKGQIWQRVIVFLGICVIISEPIIGSELRKKQSIALLKFFR